MARDRPSPYGKQRHHPLTVARGPVPRERGTAKDRPSPYGKSWRYPIIVARGPVPRDRCLHQSSVGQERLLLTRSGAGAPELQKCCSADSMARDRPSPYGKSWRYPITVARGPSDATRASERVSPVIVAWRGTGPRPTGNHAVFSDASF